MGYLLFFILMLVIPGALVFGITGLFVYLDKRGVKTYVSQPSKMNGWERRLRKKLDRAKRKPGNYKTSIKIKYH